VTVCRGCCCGTTRKHPEIDHDDQLRVLRHELDGLAAVRVSDCLDACADSNVFVVQPTPSARTAGAKPVWVGGVLDERAMKDLISWVAGGGPGLAPPPASIETRIVQPPSNAGNAQPS
jgi:hypothetical protein